MDEARLRETVEGVLEMREFVYAQAAEYTRLSADNRRLRGCLRTIQQYARDDGEGGIYVLHTPDVEFVETLDEFIVRALAGEELPEATR